MTAALVLGGADCLWADVRAAVAVGEFDCVVACNEAGSEWPGQLDALATLHAEKVEGWLGGRASNGFPEPTRVFGHHGARSRPGASLRAEYIEHRLPGQINTGSSGLFALKVALIDLGVDRAVLCGVPMDPTPHFFGGAAWRGSRAHSLGWAEAMPAIKDRARSMSGRTAQWLGRPTPEWLSAKLT